MAAAIQMTEAMCVDCGNGTGKRGGSGPAMELAATLATTRTTYDDNDNHIDEDNGPFHNLA
jgi:hypothetical protein